VDKSLFNFNSISDLTKSLINELGYFNDEDPAINVNFTEGGKYPIIVMTGENATGKSFFRRLLQVSLKKYGNIECIHLSQEDRTYSGNCFRGFIYGDENLESTGQITGRTIVNGIATCNSRETKHTIIWDEPDIGLSDAYSAGVGVKIKEFVENISELTFGVIVITHSKHLIRQLLPLNPHHLRFGDNKSLDSFLNESVEPKNIDELGDKAFETFRKISAIMKNKD
jgi:hypothetical protein